MNAATVTVSGVVFTASASSFFDGLNGMGQPYICNPYKALSGISGTSTWMNEWVSSTKPYVSTYVAALGVSKSVYTPSSGPTYQTTVSGVVTAGEWLQVESSSPMVLVAYSLQANYYTAPWAPKEFVVAGSNDNAAWTLVDTRSGIVFTSMSIQNFTLSAPVTYKFFRIIVTSLNTGNTASVIIDKWTLMSSIDNKGCVCPAGQSFDGTRTCVACSGTCSGETSKRCATTGAMVCCAAGTFFVDGTSNQCQPCPAGAYSTSGSATTCTACAAGLNSPAGSSGCATSYPMTAVLADKFCVLRTVDLATKQVSTISSQIASSFSNQRCWLAPSPIDNSFLLANDYAVYRYFPATSTASLVAGGVFSTVINGVGTGAQFSMLFGIKVAPSGTYALVCEDLGGIRRISLPDMTVTAVTAAGGTLYAEGTGTGISMKGCGGLDINPTGAFAIFSDSGSNKVRKLDLTANPPVSSFLAGSGMAGTADGSGYGAQFCSPGMVSELLPSTASAARA